MKSRWAGRDSVESKWNNSTQLSFERRLHQRWYHSIQHKKLNRLWPTKHFIKSKLKPFRAEEKCRGSLRGARPGRALVALLLAANSVNSAVELISGQQWSCPEQSVSSLLGLSLSLSPRPTSTSFVISQFIIPLPRLTLRPTIVSSLAHFILDLFPLRYFSLKQNGSRVDGAGGGGNTQIELINNHQYRYGTRHSTRPLWKVAAANRYGAVGHFLNLLERFLERFFGGGWVLAPIECCQPHLLLFTRRTLNFAFSSSCFKRGNRPHVQHESGINAVQQKPKESCWPLFSDVLLHWRVQSSAI